MVSRRENTSLDSSSFCLWKLPEEGDCGGNDIDDDVVMAKQTMTARSSAPE
jgi:hypothetical protein